MALFVRLVFGDLVAVWVAAAPARAEGNRNVRFGMPTEAKADPAYKEDP